MTENITEVPDSTPARGAKVIGMKGTRSRRSALVMVGALVLSQGPVLALGPAMVDLRSAAPFTVLAATTITTTGSGAIHGNVGLSPDTGAAIHLTQAQVDGITYSVDAAGPPGSVIAPALLTQAKGDLTTAYNDARDRLPSPVGPYLNPGAGNIGGQTLGPGLYKFTGTALITGSDLTLTGGPSDVWIFQIATDLQVGNGIKVVLAGGAKPGNIFWQVGTSAVMGTTAVFNGTILADQSITMNTGSTMVGRALASNAAVTYNGTGGSLPAPEAPHFTDISRSSTGDVALVLETTPFFEVALQTSTTLTPESWTTVLTETPSSSPWTFTQLAVEATGTQRFYRAVLTY